MPIIIVLILIFSKIKKVNAYNSFCKGAKEGFNLVLDIMPYICAIMLAIAFMRYSGLGEIVAKGFCPVLNLLGVPSELTEFIIFRPFSGSGSLALLEDIIQTFGADSRITRIACIIMGSSETVLFVSALYFSKFNNKNTTKAIVLMLFISFVGVLLSCLFA